MVFWVSLSFSFSGLHISILQRIKNDARVALINNIDTIDPKKEINAYNQIAPFLYSLQYVPTICLNREQQPVRTTPQLLCAAQLVVVFLFFPISFLRSFSFLFDSLFFSRQSCRRLEELFRELTFRT